MKGWKEKLSRMRVIALVSLFFSANILCLSGCSMLKTEVSYENNNSQVENEVVDSCTKEVFAMDTYMTLSAYGKNSAEAVDAAISEIERIEQIVSIGIESSDIAKLNRNGSGTVTQDTFYLVEKSLGIYQGTGGAFDISIYPVMEKWGFTSGDYQVPNEEELGEVLALVDSSNVLLGEDKQQVTLSKSGMKIDLGGIAKGYTSNRIMEIFKEYEIESAIVNLGGNVQVLGSKETGTPWKIAIENPEDTTSYLGVLQVTDKAVITSGGYKRYFEKEGNSYHHIIDPETGYPAANGLISVTIVSGDGTLADGLSTALFVSGKDKAIKYWKENSELFDFIFETEDGELFVSEGIYDDFSSEWEITKISK